MCPTYDSINDIDNNDIDNNVIYNNVIDNNHINNNHINNNHNNLPASMRSKMYMAITIVPAI